VNIIIINVKERKVFLRIRDNNFPNVNIKILDNMNVTAKLMNCYSRK
jgi:hypothetical protein